MNIKDLVEMLNEAYDDILESEGGNLRKSKVLENINNVIKTLEREVSK